MLKYAAIPGALVAAIALWGSFGFPTIATGAEVKSATCIALENRLTLLLAFPTNRENIVAYQNWKRSVEATQNQIEKLC